MTHFRANGKLLLTAEYSVLRGALALALPTRQGQTLNITPTGEELLHYTAKEANGEVWFSADFNPDFTVAKTTDTAIAEALLKILGSAKQLNPRFNPFGFWAETKAEFNRAWGFGSSSTLVALLAQWAQVDPLQLFFACQTGSGYDVAAGLNNSPILYQLNQNQKAEITQTHFNPPFAAELAFVYLGKKQKSEREVARFAARETSPNQLESISEITKKMVACQSLTGFEALLKTHENITGDIIGQRPIQEKNFADYPGAIKSLGAWGGDFILATRAEIAQNYFAQKGFTTILSWQELFAF